MALPEFKTRSDLEPAHSPTTETHILQGRGGVLTKLEITAQQVKSPRPWVPHHPSPQPQRPYDPDPGSPTPLPAVPQGLISE